MNVNRERLASGSGVIAGDSSGSRYLITAGHNLSGKEPGSNLAKSKTAGLPNRLRIEGCGVDFTVNLYAGDNDPNSDHPLYAVHPKGSAIDVTLLRLPNEVRIDHPLHNSFLQPRFNSELRLHVGQKCYILGFPEGLVHRPFEGAVFSIWKTGSIASEPEFDFHGQPKLLIDATTRKGMSGAMVMVSERDRNRFVGIYTGRYKQPVTDADDPERDLRFTAELGWVFRSEVVNELISTLRGS